jgi:aminoglycoside 3-N-acetyltransferase I
MKLTREDIQIKHLEAKDLKLFQKLIQLFQDVFEMENLTTAKEPYLKELLEKPDFIVFAVIYKEEIVGGLTAYELPLYYSQCSEVFIYDLAIRTEFQRNGLGKMLLTYLKEYCKEKGIKQIFVAANEEDEYALEFYHSSGGRPENVIHFNYTATD